jgi:hypothetical protein
VIIRDHRFDLLMDRLQTRCPAISLIWMRISRRHSVKSREQDLRSLSRSHHRYLRLRPRPQVRCHRPIFASLPTPTCSAQYLNLSAHRYLNIVNMLDPLLRLHHSLRRLLKPLRSHHTRIRLPLDRNHLVVEERKRTKSGMIGLHLIQNAKEQRGGDLNLKSCGLVPLVQRTRKARSARHRQRRRGQHLQAPRSSR